MDKSKTVWLRRYLDKMQAIERLKNRLECVDDRLVSCRVSNPSGSRGGIPQPLEDLIADKEALLARIETAEGIANGYKREIYQAIDGLTNATYAEIIESHFIDNKSIEDIAEDLQYSVRHTFKLYSQAVDAIEISID